LSVKYAEASLATLRAQKKALLERLGELARPELEKHRNARKSEFVDEIWSSQAGEEDLIYWVVDAPEGSNDAGTHRVLLPKSEFPDLYAIKRETLWLGRRARDLERKEALEKRERDKG